MRREGIEELPLLIRGNAELTGLAGSHSHVEPTAVLVTNDTNVQLHVLPGSIGAGRQQHIHASAACLSVLRNSMLSASMCNLAVSAKLFDRHHAVESKQTS